MNRQTRLNAFKPLNLPAMERPSLHSLVHQGQVAPDCNKGVFRGVGNGSRRVTRISFLKLLNFDPNCDKGLIVSSEVEIRRILKEKPEFGRQRYQFKAFPGHKISPLSMLCALGATRKTIECCYDTDQHAATEVDKLQGTTLHYACAYGADKSVVEFLLSILPKGYDAMINFDSRNPLHVAAMGNTSIEIVSLLAKRFPLGLHMTDHEGNTPLHIAIEHGTDAAVVEALMGKSAGALCCKKNFVGASPLHLAVFNDEPLPVIQALVRGYDRALRLVDAKGRLPLHVAARKTDCATIVYLVRHFPVALTKKDKQGRTPYDIAKKFKRPSELRLMLKLKQDDM